MEIIKRTRIRYIAISLHPKTPTTEPNEGSLDVGDEPLPTASGRLGSIRDHCLVFGGDRGTVVSAHL